MIKSISNSFYLALGLFVSASVTSAQINVNFAATAGNFGDPIFESDGSTQVTSGSLGLLIVDTLGDGVVLSETTFSAESFLGGSDNWLVGTLSSSDIFGDSVVGTTGLGVTTSDISPGQPFYIAWIPQRTSGETILVEGDSYGISRRSDWLVPSDGGSTMVSNSPGGPATSTVVPELSSFSLIAGVLGLGFALVRRRRS